MIARSEVGKVRTEVIHVATFCRGNVCHSLGADLMCLSLRAGDQDSRTEFIYWKLIHDGKQLLLDNLCHIMFDSHVQSTNAD